MTLKGRLSTVGLIGFAGLVLMCGVLGVCKGCKERKPASVYKLSGPPGGWPTVSGRDSSGKPVYSGVTNEREQYLEALVEYYQRELDRQRRLGTTQEQVQPTHVGVVPAEDRARLDSVVPMVFVSYRPGMVEWLVYKDGVAGSSRRSLHSTHFKLTADKYGIVDVRQNVVDFGLRLTAAGRTPVDTLVPKFDAAVYLTVSRGPLTWGIGAGYDGAASLRTLFELRLF
jgi:hypothetical protein